MRSSTASCTVWMTGSISSTIAYSPGSRRRTGLIVVDHRTHVGPADHADLAVADLDEHWWLLGLRRSDDREQDLMVVDVEGPDREMVRP
jgi:hypothetical protein